MAYSGTVGQTVVTVQNFIDQGARHSGKLAEELTVEQVQASKQALFFIMSNLINQGVNYWAIEKKVYGLNADQYEYLLPVGGNDVLNALYRSMDRPTGAYASSAGGNAANAFDSNLNTYCQQTSANGNISVNYGTNQNIYAGSIGFMPYMPSTASWNVVFETSADGVTWTQLDSFTQAVQDGAWVWTDIDPGAAVPYYRMRVAGTGQILSLRELYIGTNSREITMARLNRDDYTNLPNKNFTANQPYQYWFNRTLPQSKITLWPTPSDPFIQMVVWYSRQVMDVGDLNGELEIPQYFNQAIQMMLSHQMSLLLPGVGMDRITYLEGQAEKYFIMAENENRDRSPIYYSPNISVYTR
jgi:hypothetical protein